MTAPHIVADRCAETTATTGTGTISLAGAVRQYQTLAQGVGSGNETDYCLMSGDGIAWEVGRGTVTGGSPGTLSRDIVYASSAAGGLIILSGTSTVFQTASARFLTRDRTSIKIADYGVLVAESGTIFNNIGATGTVNLTLPVAEKDLRYGFLVDASFELGVIAQAGESIAVGSTNSAAGGSAVSNIPFSFLSLGCHKAGQWVADRSVGAWTVT